MAESTKKKPVKARPAKWETKNGIKNMVSPPVNTLESNRWFFDNGNHVDRISTGYDNENFNMAFAVWQSRNAPPETLPETIMEPHADGDVEKQVYNPNSEKNLERMVAWTADAGQAMFNIVCELMTDPKSIDPKVVKKWADLREKTKREGVNLVIDIPEDERAIWCKVNTNLVKRIPTLHENPITALDKAVANNDRDDQEQEADEEKSDYEIEKAKEARDQEDEENGIERDEDGNIIVSEANELQEWFKWKEAEVTGVRTLDQYFQYLEG